MPSGSRIANLRVVILKKVEMFLNQGILFEDSWSPPNIILLTQLNFFLTFLIREDEEF